MHGETLLKRQDVGVQSHAADHAAGREGVTVRVKDDSRVVGDEVTADAAGLAAARAFAREEAWRAGRPHQRARTGRERCRIATGTPPNTSHSPAQPTRETSKLAGPRGRGREPLPRRGAG